jgi:hypothetical protein
MSKNALITTAFGAVAICVAMLLLAGCGSTSGAAQPPTTSSRSAAGTTTVPSPCEQVFAERSEELASGRDVGDALAYVGAYAPRKCRSLEEADLAAREAFGDDVGMMVTDGLAGACREAGQQIGIANTQVCRDAAEPVTESESVLEEDFANGCGPWYHDRDHFANFSCADGVYRIRIKDPAREQHARLSTGRIYQNLAIEADSSLVAPWHGTFEAHGVSCWTGDGVGYLFAVAPDGSFGIVKEWSAKQRVKLLAQGTSAQIERGAGPVIRIRGECRSGSKTELRLLVNGSVVSTVRDRHGATSFSGFGVFVNTTKAKTQVEIANIAVTSL